MKNFIRKNGLLIVIAISVICVGTIIGVAINAANTDFNKPKVTPTPKPAIVTPTPSPIVPTDTLPTNLTLPVANATIGLDYTMESFVFSQTLNQWQTHSGLDFISPEGTSVVAIYAGVVDKVITNDVLNGGTVVIKHNNGLESIYMSLGSGITLKVGDSIQAGDKIGVTSASAYNEFKEGAHLHLEMKKDGKYLDPKTFFKDLKGEK